MKLLRAIKTLYEVWEDVDPGPTLTMISPSLCNIISSCYFITNHHNFPNSSPPISPAWEMGVFCRSLTLETVAETESDVWANIFSLSAPLSDPHHLCLSGPASSRKCPVLWKVWAYSATKFGHPVQGTRIHQAFQYQRNLKNKIISGKVAKLAKTIIFPDQLFKNPSLILW